MPQVSDWDLDPTTQIIQWTWEDLEGGWYLRSVLPDYKWFAFKYDTTNCMAVVIAQSILDAFAPDKDLALVWKK